MIDLIKQLMVLLADHIGATDLPGGIVRTEQESLVAGTPFGSYKLSSIEEVPPLPFKKEEESEDPDKEKYRHHILDEILLSLTFNAGTQQLNGPDPLETAGSLAETAKDYLLVDGLSAIQGLGIKVKVESSLVDRSYYNSSSEMVYGFGFDIRIVYERNVVEYVDIV